ncbi:hypothetical protein F5144DRAFT_647669 [Chaetomium tenue]|uniref:Uncharacterized protein n=1 Tax=Chaetomium tenue TaxID=1854479 RepID=A0ACB7P4K1_9PEZI|nr:hypothetical protein F5144DRAFT_647669 [Chaetomium globosum]
MNPLITYRSPKLRERDQKVPDSDEERNPTQSRTELLAADMPTAQEQTAQEPPAESLNAGELMLLVQLEEIPAATRAEFRRMSPEVKPEANDLDFISDNEHGEQRHGQVKRRSDESDEGGHQPPRRRQKRRKAASHGRNLNEDDSDNTPISQKRRRRVCGVPNGLAASVDRFISGLPQVIAETQRWMAENLPRISGLSEVQRMLPRLRIGSTWTANDRDEVDRAWDKSAHREKLLDVAKNKEMLTLYKCCLRLMRCLPEDIISCRFDLEYDIDQNRALTRGQSLLWSGPFCQSLAALLVHPMWDGAVAPLAAATQYTVIVETKNDGPWAMEVPGFDTFLAELLRRKREQPDKNTAELRRQLHVEMAVPEKDIYGRITGICHSRWDILFQTIENLTVLDAEPSDQTPPLPRQTRGASEPFLVHRRHLELLTKALNSMTHMGFPMFMPLELMYRGISGRRSVRDYPQANQIVALREYSLLCERERVAYKAKLALAGQETNGPAADEMETHGDLDTQPHGEPEISKIQASGEPETQSHEETSVPVTQASESQSDEEPEVPVSQPGKGPETQTREDPTVPVTQASKKPETQAPSTSENGEAYTHSRGKTIPKTQYSTRGQKMKQPSEAESISPDTAQKRARNEVPSGEGPPGNQLGLRPPTESSSGEWDRLFGHSAGAPNSLRAEAARRAKASTSESFGDPSNDTQASFTPAR